MRLLYAALSKHRDWTIWSTVNDSPWILETITTPSCRSKSCTLARCSGVSSSVAFSWCGCWSAVVMVLRIRLDVVDAVQELVVFHWIMYCWTMIIKRPNIQRIRCPLTGLPEVLVTLLSVAMVLVGCVLVLLCLEHQKKMTCCCASNIRPRGLTRLHVTPVQRTLFIVSAAGASPRVPYIDLARKWWTNTWTFGRILLLSHRAIWVSLRSCHAPRALGNKSWRWRESSSMLTSLFLWFVN